MKFVTDPLRALVQKKLWPVAVLLIAALVAVPYTLAKEPEAPPPAPANAAANEEAGMPATFVSAVDESAGEEKRRRVLGASKDPFEPAPLPKAKKSKKKQDADKPKDEKAETKPESKPPSGGGGSTQPPPAPVPTVTFPANSIIVGFDKTAENGAEPKLQALEKMKALPSEDNPLIVFTGLKNNGKSAEFMLTGIVTAEGDGKCRPRPEDCQTLRLRKGETQFLTITGTGDETDGQYQLDVHEIFAKKTAVPINTKIGDGLRKKASRIFLNGGK